MTDLSPREKELVEAAKLLLATNWDGNGGIMLPVSSAIGMISKALRAYDPPKREYTMPTWEEFHPAGWSKGIVNLETITVQPPGLMPISRDQYSAIREATSKEVKS